MEHYKIKSGGFDELKKQTLKRIVPMMVIAVAVGVSISSINAKDNGVDMNILPIVIPIIAIVSGFALYRGTENQSALFESYQLTITENHIERQQMNTPTISIYFNEISEIVKSKNGSFLIKGRQPSDIIIVPTQIDDYEKLEQTLERIRPFAAKPNTSFWQKYSIPITLLTLGLMICVYTVSNKIIVAICGTALVALLLWSLREAQRSKNIDAKVKRSLWWVLIVVGSVIGVMLMKLI